MRRYCFALDLIADDELIATYEEHHKKVWPEILSSIKDSGIEDLAIYRTGNRLFMIMEVNDSFSFEAKAATDAQSEIVQQWENLMWKFQQALPWAEDGEKWILMDQIFQL